MPDIRKYLRNKRAIEKKRVTPFNQEEASYEEKLQRHRKIVVVRSVGLCVILLIACFLASAIYRNLVYEKIEVLETAQREESMMSQYYSLGTYVLRCSRDGAACMDSKGETVWDLTYEMDTPLVDVCQNYAVIAEASGNKIYIVNKEGKQGELETLLPIRQVRVAAQGVVVVVLEDENKNWINFYDKDGELLAENKAPLSSRGYPLSLDVSEDGKKLAVSYVQIEGTKTESVVAFYNFDSVGYNVTDHLMSSTVYEDTLFPTVAFLTNTVAVAFGDNMCIAYEGAQNPEEQFRLTFEEKIQSIFYDESHIGLIFQSDSDNSLYEMKVYSRKGKLLMNCSLNQSYEKVKLIDDQVVVIGQQELSIYNMKGKLKFSGTTEQEISDVMGTGKAYRYCMIYPTKWERVRLK